MATVRVGTATAREKRVAAQAGGECETVPVRAREKRGDGDESAAREMWQQW